jgi:hypothetical protein
VSAAIRDRLVATGCPDADAYLRLCARIAVMQKAADRARDAVDGGRPRAPVMYGGWYAPAEDVLAKAHADLDAAWARAHAHLRAARPDAAAAADAEACALFEETGR